MISQNIGWTLIHSLWQGLIIYVLVKGTFGLTKKADVRYGAGVVALGVMLMCSLTTFLFLNRSTASEGFSLIINATVAGTSSSVQTVFGFIDQNIIWLLRFWITGFAFGILRVVVGLLYINRLRRNANVVADEWMELVKDVSRSLSVKRVVTIAEATISSPMVVGFLKPMILFPVGLLSGLTTEQVEAILVHELSHIRRQDYIINLVQSVIETIFFFNPFVLLISALIREERENCCDDLVIAKGISPISYVKTLAQLEASCLSADAVRSSSSLALGIAGNQNQLLNRIKRIMENSAKNDWGKGRLVPVTLLFLGLVCASWLSIGSEKKEGKEINLVPKVAQYAKVALDTPKENGLKVIKKRNNGWTTEETIELPLPPQEYSEKELAKIWESVPHEFEFNFDEMAVPGFPDGSPVFEMPPIEMLADMPNFDYEIFDMGDSVPAYSFNLRSPEDWDAFEKEFKEKFKSQFKDFYQKNEKQFDKMLDEMKKAEHGRREAAEVVDLKRIAREHRSEDMMMAVEMAQRSKAMAQQQREMNLLQKKESLQLAEELRSMAEKQRYAADVLKDQYQKQSLEYNSMSRRVDECQKALIEQLIADGYFKAGESVDKLNINDNDNEMTVNGKKIKEKDRLKYKALQDQYFRKSAPLIPGRSE